MIYAYQQVTYAFEFSETYTLGYLENYEVTFTFLL